MKEWLSSLNWHWVIEQNLLVKPLNTVLLIAFVLLLRAFLIRRIIRHHAGSTEVRRRWLVNLRGALLFLLALGLMTIWASQLRSLALSVVAMGAAIVIATKELILCVSGSFLRAGTKAFTVGDRIEINGMRGDVIDQNLFATTLLEIGPGQTVHQHTGRAVVVPNSLLLNMPVINETFMEDYVVHAFTVPMRLEEDWRRAERLLLEAAQAECAPYLEEARLYMKHLEKTHSLDTPSVDPRVTLQMPEAGRIHLLARMPTPARLKGRLEQAVLRRFLDAYQGQTAPGSGT
jgi:small-conductance mechanosensitive channel